MIHLSEKDYVINEEIKNLFSLQVGSLHRSLKAKSILFKVYSVKDLRVIKNHFDKYSMITEECSDYKLFSLVYELVERKEHLTQYGLRKIVAIKAGMNRGLSDELK